MKCPRCELRTSDSNNQCPRCELDFTSIKDRLGIKASAPKQKKAVKTAAKPANNQAPQTSAASAQVKSPATSPATEKKVSEKKLPEKKVTAEKKSWFSSLFSKGKKELQPDATSSASTATKTEPAKKEAAAAVNTPVEIPPAVKTATASKQEAAKALPKPSPIDEDPLFAMLLQELQESPGAEDQQNLDELISALEDISGVELKDTQQSARTNSDEASSDKFFNSALYTLDQTPEHSESVAPIADLDFFDLVGKLPTDDQPLFGANNEELEDPDEHSDQYSASTSGGLQEILGEDESLSDLFPAISQSSGILPQLDDDLFSALDGETDFLPEAEGDFSTGSYPSSTGFDSDALLADLSRALDQTLEEAGAATASLSNKRFVEEDDSKFEASTTNEEPSSYEVERAKIVHAAAQRAVPEVMEFSEEDDALFEETLDQLLDDTQLDVSAVKVKTEKPEQPPAALVIDDMEISFEFDEEQEEEEEEEQADSDDLMSGLMSSFEKLQSETTHKSIVTEHLDLDVEPVLTALPDTASDTEHDLLSALDSLLGNEQEEEVVAKDKNSQESLDLLALELESELAELAKEGTSFFADPELDQLPAVTTAEVNALAEPEQEVAAEAEEELSPEMLELAQLQAELGSELDALAAEGTTFSIDTLPQQAEPLIDAVSTGSFLLSDLQGILGAEELVISDQPGEPDQTVEDDFSQELAELESSLEDYEQNEPQQVVPLVDAVSTGSFLLSDLQGILGAEELVISDEPEDKEQEIEAEAEVVVKDCHEENYLSSTPQQAEPLIDAVSTGAFLLSDLNALLAQDREEDIPTGVFIVDQEKLSQSALNGAASKLPEITEQSWAEAEQELQVQQLLAGENLTGEIEISGSEINPFSQSDTADVLFHAVARELSEPGVELKGLEQLPNSTKRKVKSSSLEKAVTNYGVEQVVYEKLQLEKQEQQAAGFTYEEIEIDVQLAPIWRRVAAMLTDVLVIVALGSAISWLTIMTEAVKSQLSAGVLPSVVTLTPCLFDFLLVVYGCWLVLSTMMLASDGQTVGGKLFGIQVVNMSGFPLSLSQSLARSLLQVATLCTLGLGLLPLFTANKRTLHDSLSRTQVVYKVSEELYTDDD